MKSSGILLAITGISVVWFADQIVFPGLECLLGIETIVGKDNVVYQPDGSYVFTNPKAMIKWITCVRVTGLIVAAIGIVRLFRKDPTAEKIST